MKKHTVFAKVLIVLLCIAMLFSGCKGKDSGSDNPESNKPTTPGEILEDTLDKTLGGAPSILEEALKCGKITVKYQDSVENVLYLDADGSRIVDQLMLKMDSEEYNLNIFGSEDSLAVSAPEILGDVAYGIVFSTLENDLQNSPLWEMAGIDYEEVLSQAGLGDLDISDVLDMTGRAMEIMMGFEDAMDDAMAKIESSSSEGTVSINGKDVEATIVTYKVTDDMVSEMSDILIDWAEDAINDVIADVKETLNNEQVNDALEELEIPFDELRNQIEEMFGDIDFTLNVNVNVNAESDYLMSVNADVVIKYVGDNEEDAGEEVSAFCNIVLGEDPSNSNKYTFEVGATNPDGETVGAKAEISRDITDAEAKYALSLKVSEGGEENEVFTGNLTYNKENNKFTASAEVDGNELKVTGSYKLTDDVLMLGLDKITVDGDTMDIGVEVSIESINSSEIPNTPDVKNLLTMSEADFQELAEKIQEKFN